MVAFVPLCNSNNYLYMTNVKIVLKIAGLVLLILCIGGLLVSRLWGGDNTDNLIGGCLISHGETLYKDFFPPCLSSILSGWTCGLGNRKGKLWGRDTNPDEEEGKAEK